MKSYGMFDGRTKIKNLYIITKEHDMTQEGKILKKPNKKKRQAIVNSRCMAEKSRHDGFYHSRIEKELTNTGTHDEVKYRGRREYINPWDNRMRYIIDALIDVIDKQRAMIRSGGHPPSDFRNQGYEKNEHCGHSDEREHGSNKCLEINIKIPLEVIKWALEELRRIWKGLKWIVFWLFFLFSNL